MPRLNEEDLKAITSRSGYGIARGGIKAGIKGSLARQVSDSRALDDVESNSGDGPLDAKKLQVGCPDRVTIRLTFYRRRLTDYGESCSRAISEKALIDSLVYAGLIQGDSGAEVRVEDGGQKKVESNEEERTEVELIYPEVNYDAPWIKAKKNLAH